MGKEQTLTAAAAKPAPVLDEGDAATQSCEVKPREAAAEAKETGVTVSGSKEEVEDADVDDDDDVPLSSKLLATFLDSKLDRLLADVDQQLAQADAEASEESKEEAQSSQESQATQSSSLASKASSAENDAVLLQWIEHTLKARGVEVSPSACAAVLESLRAMAASDDTALSQRTMRAITRLARKDQQNRDEAKADKKADDASSSDKPKDADSPQK